MNPQLQRVYYSIMGPAPRSARKGHRMLRKNVCVTHKGLVGQSTRCSDGRSARRADATATPKKMPPTFFQKPRKIKRPSAPRLRLHVRPVLLSPSFLHLVLRPSAVFLQVTASRHRAVGFLAPLAVHL